MSFRAVFAAVFLGTALIVAAFMLNRARPKVEVAQPNAALVRASGKCAECHLRESAAVVHEYAMSRHAAVGTTCLDCHQPMAGQKQKDHRGFVIAEQLTAANCAQCHAGEYQQYLRSRHAAPAWAAVSGAKDFTPEQIAFAEQYHPGWVKRSANALVSLEGAPAVERGCRACHVIGKPNSDGSIGTCTACHTRHVASVAVARMPTTCGQCHMGPDHSQIEIYDESKHGVLFVAQRDKLNLNADPKKLTTDDMFVPTCATCHMSGLNGTGVSHDTTRRLSYYLFAEVSDRRPNAAQGQAAMQQLCTQCHTQPSIDQFYAQAQDVVASTNEKIRAAKAIMDGLYQDGLLTKTPFDAPIKFLYFNMWHYDGRTAKHGAFMGGPDFVQWHGNYELLLKGIEIKNMAEEIRAAQRDGHGAATGAADHANAH